MKPPVPVRRLIYRVGYRVLHLVWLFTRPNIQGVKCLLTDEDLILLVRHTYGRGWWDLPGGQVRRGEPPQRAARREMSEELGLHEAEWEPVCRVQVDADHRRDTLHCFRCELHAPRLEIERAELLEVGWFRRAELPHDLAPHVIPILAWTTVRRKAG